jgi:acylphosphatase
MFMKRWVKITVFGELQGVGYAEHVKKYADVFKIEGTLQLGEQSSMVIHAVGTSEELDNFIDHVYQGSAQSVVDEVAIEIAQPGRDYRGVFRIISGR